jgi:DNA-binding transcriptional regulator YiaG
MRSPPEEAVSRELAVIRRAYQRAERAILHTRQPEDGFKAADTLARELRELYETEAARLVARAAARLRASRRYSLAELARAVNVSKSMAAYWDRRARGGE